MIHRRLELAGRLRTPLGQHVHLLAGRQLDRRAEWAVLLASRVVQRAALGLTRCSVLLGQSVPVLLQLHFDLVQLRVRFAHNVEFLAMLLVTTEDVG